MPTARTTTRKQPAHLVFERMIVETVYKPPIISLLKRFPDRSPTFLAETFAEEHDCTVSPSTFRRWLTLLGITYKRVASYETATEAEGEDEGEVSDG